MSVCPPRNLTPNLLIDAAAGALEVEILAEKAEALARAGRKVEDALAALRAVATDSPGRGALVRAAAAQGYFIQRELMGFHRPTDIVEAHAIPLEVLAKIGVR